MLLAFSDTTKTLVVAITGIGVSGLLGPSATAWATRRGAKQQFERDQRARRRDDFRQLVDDAAKLLGVGVTNLRIGREAKAAGRSEPQTIKEWASEVHLLRQRLLLRRAANDRVLTSYSAVLDALQVVAAARADQDYEQAVDEYTKRMNDFLSAARSSLEAPVE
jgi:hypothetical protein